MSRSRRRWDAARCAHRAALDDFARRARAVSPERWLAPAGAGKWSPAEETLHVTRAYEVAIGEVEGEPAMRARVAPWRARILRWFLLPHLLRTGRFPPRVAAPVEIRPNAVEAEFVPAQSLLARLDAQARACEEALERAALGGRRSLRLEHPYFGPLRPLAVLRLLTVHTAHHARRLPGAAAPGS